MANVDEQSVRVTGDAFQIDPLVAAPVVAMPMLLALFIAMLVSGRRKRRRHQVLSQMEVNPDETE